MSIFGGRAMVDGDKDWGTNLVVGIWAVSGQQVTWN